MFLEPCVYLVNQSKHWKGVHWLETKFTEEAWGVSYIKSPGDICPVSPGLPTFI